MALIIQTAPITGNVHSHVSYAVAHLTQSKSRMDCVSRDGRVVTPGHYSEST